MVYAALTNNARRAVADAANPRTENHHGHVLEILEDGNDAGATGFTWRIFLLAGDPADPSTYFAGFPPEMVSPISCPDNLVFDHSGNLWIATDGASSTLLSNDALHAVPVAGPERGHVRQFLSVPKGAEPTGPTFTPDDRTLFLSIQHPGAGGSLAAPVSTWPDRTNAPRPSVIAVSRARPARQSRPWDRPIGR